MDELIQNTSRSTGSLELTTSTSFTSIIENGSFETGDFSNWRTIGDTSIETDDLGIFPSDGTFQALLTNGSSDAGGSVVDSDLEEFLDLPPGSLDGLVGGDATEGSVIKQTFTVQAGDIVSFDWNFLTNEATSSATFNDTAFLTVNGFTLELADTGANFADASDIDEFAEQTGTQTLTFSIADAGTYTIGFGVVDVGDAIVDSGLVVDNIQIQSLNSDPIFTTSELGSDAGMSGVDLVFGENGFESVDSSPSSSSNSGTNLVLGENGFEVV